MKVHYTLDTFSAHKPVVTIGMFDGVHVGHQKVLEHVGNEAKKIQGESVVLTFWPHPQVFFGRKEHFSLLTTLEEKIALLQEFGIDHCIILPFDTDFSQLSAEEYISSILHKAIGAVKIIIGYDHRYGKHGKGDFTLMQTMGKLLGFEVAQIPAFDIDLVHISSTKIRDLLHEGNLPLAAQYLGYTYFIEGKVQPGKQIGRTIQVPTANIKPNFDLKTLPALGVYVAQVKLHHTIYNAVASVGKNPTIDEQNHTIHIEAHILDYSGDLYNEQITIYFIEKIRNEEKFPSLEALKSAIQNDIAVARKKLTKISG